jgi:hypothetical protein
VGKNTSPIRISIPSDRIRLRGVRKPLPNAELSKIWRDPAGSPSYAVLRSIDEWYVRSDAVFDIPVKPFVEAMETPQEPKFADDGINRLVEVGYYYRQGEWLIPMEEMIKRFRRQNPKKSARETR